MSPRARKGFGILLLIAGLLLYAGAVGHVATTYLPEHWLVDLIFYPLAGLVWLLPAVPLVKWMQARDVP